MQYQVSNIPVTQRKIKAMVKEDIRRQGRQKMKKDIMGTYPQGIDRCMGANVAANAQTTTRAKFESRHNKIQTGP